MVPQPLWVLTVQENLHLPLVLQVQDHQAVQCIQYHQRVLTIPWHPEAQVYLSDQIRQWRQLILEFLAVLLLLCHLDHQ